LASRIKSCKHNVHVYSLQSLYTQGLRSYTSKLSSCVYVAKSNESHKSTDETDQVSDD